MNPRQVFGTGGMVLALAAAWTAQPVHAEDGDPSTSFPSGLLGQKEYVDAGRGVFGQICKFCHGKSAYPGKAPRLNPARYTPEFVYDRVTNGFRGMPPFKEQYSDEERRAVVVYIMSKEFSN